MKKGILFLTLIPVDGLLIYFSTYMYRTVILMPRGILRWLSLVTFNLSIGIMLHHGNHDTGLSY